MAMNSTLRELLDNWGILLIAFALVVVLFLAALAALAGFVVRFAWTLGSAL